MSARQSQHLLVYPGIVEQFAEAGKPFGRNHKQLAIGKFIFRIFVNQVLSEFDEGDAELDRKSTRLNSSHVRISYAVFCLKKKNLMIQGTGQHNQWGSE